MLRLLRIVEVAIAGIMLYSGLQHAANPYLFANAIAAYRVLPVSLLSLIPFVLPHLMIVIAVCLLTSRLTLAARWISLGLFSVFVASQLWVWKSGTEISCGCFGYSLEPISLKSISLPVLCGLGCLGLLLTPLRPTEVA